MSDHSVPVYPGHWVIKGGSAEAQLREQGYTPDPTRKGRQGWIFMVKRND